MGTDTTTAKLKAFANRLRSFSSDAGDSLNNYKANVYLHFAPADAPLPHVVLAQGPSSTDPDYGDLREIFEVDAFVYGRARKDEPIVSTLADLCTQALIAFRESGPELGFVSVTSVRRGVLEFLDSPTGEELIGLPVTAEAFAWPALLTDALT